MSYFYTFVFKFCKIIKNGVTEQNFIIWVFVFIYIFIFTRELCILLPSVLLFQLEGPPQQFFQGRYNGNKLHQFLFIWECLNFSLIFEGQCCYITDVSFSLSTLNASSHCLLVFSVSTEKSSYLIADPFYITSYFSAFNILFVFNFLQFGYGVSQNGFLCVFPT